MVSTKMELAGVKIDFLGHDGFLIALNGTKIVIDPYNVSMEVAKEKADLILVTHSHYDHCSIKDIEVLAKKGTIIACPADCQSKITRIEGVEMHIVEINDAFSLKEKITIEAVPAYNIGKEFHPQNEEWLGYLIKFGNIIIYHAGDTDKIPEMSRLSGYGKQENSFIALLPVSGTYVMSAEEAAEAASLINPSLAVPMHYGSGVAGTREDAERFVKICLEKGIKAEILEKI